jgi:hypothetical protein
VNQKNADAEKDTECGDYLRHRLAHWLAVPGSAALRNSRPTHGGLTCLYLRGIPSPVRWWNSYRYRAYFTSRLNSAGFSLAFARGATVTAEPFDRTGFGTAGGNPRAELRGPSLIEASLKVKRNNAHG